MTRDEMIRLLAEINVICRDNGRRFTEFPRINVIREKLKNSTYLCTQGELCLIYSKKPLDQFDEEAVLLSTHIDCVRNITRCFSMQCGNGMLKGTYDNSITNTAALVLMLEDRLPGNVIISFTGDEEIDSHGALETCRILRKNGIDFKAVILDVTDEGWHRSADVSMENDFFAADSPWGNRVIRRLIETVQNWCFVPEDPSAIPPLVPAGNRIPKEAEADESWDYDEKDVECFSLCLPISGEMHCDEGVYCRESSFFAYINALESICCH